MLSIVGLGGEHLVVGDQMGVVRVFNRAGTRCRSYEHHCTMVNRLALSKDLELLASTSQHDRGLVLWAVEPAPSP